MLPAGVSDFCRRFWDDCIHTTCYFPTEKSKNEEMLKFRFFCPAFCLSFPLLAKLSILIIVSLLVDLSAVHVS